MVDVSQHKMVPEHSIVDSDEIDEVLAEYDIKSTDLPKIKRTDPALPDDAEPGDVIKIVRNSRTTENAVVYRLVVE
ncbi:DNA-directed RNA polymerase subunit H [Haladaptatus paucihalophilus DX253]|uniref:DNA-directed RNA polymerase subunit Rpo5 n=1 Tax=Haladaptatus paucihalophilus DX253 TaxID=797209 RepID=E7QTR1_HALPU|nr:MULTISPECIES: DNA-directed RNA polymerase subunit H [Haladaptatus]EFW91990.1 DNA-directed RNA polymerase subunit H [Haladaptatus paucihalophilus DX253]ODR83515.1 DNA-directed RNA polymerase subunit H [Haladaptatus sp. W1]GKZ14145.1 DNA-directed RNA polymerase subunit H [Haladaptatus sp. T7]SHK85042.1 DNA-directed RNA polymerase, subunit H [Haladaptatus paucihalophilus DX253]